MFPAKLSNEGYSVGKFGGDKADQNAGEDAENDPFDSIQVKMSDMLCVFFLR